MASGKTLGIIRRAESLARIPHDAIVLPLEFRLQVPTSHALADRPERLLSPEDERAIEGAARQMSTHWSSGAGLRERLQFEGLDVAGSFTYELEMAARDFAKAAWIARRCLERVTLERLVTDVPPLSDSAPPYPYLSALGTILEAEAKATGIPFVNLAALSARAAAKRKTALETGYAALAARRGLRRLRSGGILLAVGPFPEFYRPLAAAWQSGDSQTVVLTRAALPMRPDSRLGLHLVTLESLQDADDRRRLQEYLDTSLDELSRLSWRAGLVVADVDLTPAFRTDLAARFQRDGQAVASVARGVRRNLARVARIVLAESWSPFSKAILSEARRAEIPTTLLQHGVLAGAFSYGVAEADRIGAWGPSDATWFRERLGNKVRVAPTGSPRYDHLAQSNPETAEGNPAGVPRREPVVLFASQPFVQDRARRSPWDRAKIIESVLTTSRQLPEARFIIKWNPAEQPEAGIDDVVSQVHRGNTLDLLRRSDVVLVVSSTVALEAMYLDRPVIFLGRADADSPFHPPEDGAGIRADGPDELLQQLRSLLANPLLRERVTTGQRAFLSRSYAPLDGQAAMRVSALVREV